MKFIIPLLLSCITISVSAQDAEKYYNQAMEKGKAGKFDEMITLLTKSIELDGEVYIAWFNRGIAHAMLNQYEKALSDYQQTIKLNPSFKRAYLNCGIAKRYLTDYDGAIRIYSELIEADSGYADAWYNRATVYEWIGKRDSACYDYTMAKEAGAEKMEAKMKMCSEPPNEKLHSILKLTQTATSDKYGYTQEDPVMVGNGPFGGPANQRAFLQLLRDSHGNPVQYNRSGSCCPYKSDNAPMGYAMLDRYEVKYTDKDGKPATVIIFISMYDYKEPMIPVGFGTIK
ncbi:MAG: tetratricopeptide repeat protein [Chitinophagaceae bacterium]|nr:tetratricopeptide repeat protein [Chitinophagaceae bacterium]